MLLFWNKKMYLPDWYCRDRFYWAGPRWRRWEWGGRRCSGLWQNLPTTETRFPPRTALFSGSLVRPFALLSKIFFCKFWFSRRWKSWEESWSSRPLRRSWGEPWRSRWGRFRRKCRSREVGEESECARRIGKWDRSLWSIWSGNRTRSRRETRPDSWAKICRQIWRIKNKRKWGF